MTLRGSLSIACDFSLQRIGYVILSIFPQDDSEILEIKGNPHTTEKNKKVSVPQCAFAGACIMGGIIWMEFNSCENVPPAPQLIQYRS